MYNIIHVYRISTYYYIGIHSTYFVFIIICIVVCTAYAIHTSLALCVDQSAVRCICVAYTVQLRINPTD